VGTVTAWHEALNDGDAERLVALSRPDVEMGGPRGTVSGSTVLREWVARANIRLVPRRIFHGAEKVVVEQEAEWRDAETGEATGSRIVASTFTVKDGLVACVVRHDGGDALGHALRKAGLDESYESRPARPHVEPQ
jgi:hypothetical protein